MHKPQVGFLLLLLSLCFLDQMIYIWSGSEKGNKNNAGKGKSITAWSKVWGVRWLYADTLWIVMVGAFWLKSNSLFNIMRVPYASHSLYSNCQFRNCPWPIQKNCGLGCFLCKMVSRDGFDLIVMLKLKTWDLIDWYTYQNYDMKTAILNGKPWFYQTLN